MEHRITIYANVKTTNNDTRCNRNCKYLGKLLLPDNFDVCRLFGVILKNNNGCLICEECKEAITRKG